MGSITDPPFNQLLTWLILNVLGLQERDHLDHEGAADKAGSPGLFCLEKRMITEALHRIPLPCTRIERERERLIPSTEMVGWAIKDQVRFRASRIYTEWWGGAYLVWYDEYWLVFVHTAGKWYSLKTYPPCGRQYEEMFEQLRNVLHPTLFDRDVMLHVVAQHGEEGVVRYMMGLEC